MSDVNLEDIPIDVACVVNSVEHLCDAARNGHLHQIGAYLFELGEASDKLSDLAIKLIELRNSYNAQPH